MNRLQPLWKLVFIKHQYFTHLTLKMGHCLQWHTLALSGTTAFNEI